MRNLKKWQSIAAFLFFGLIWGLPVYAAHIIGGDITYQCLSVGKYRFTMKIYRDCNGGGAPYDSGPGAPFPASVSVFQGNSNSPFITTYLTAPVITRIEPNLSNPCLIAPPNVCVEQGVYIFDLDLPVSSQSYHIVYQRCCRNNTITNIFSPGQTGATYWMELTAAAQQVCNDSPTFTDFPPIVICAGEPINFDHSATDTEGDQLVYELCTPFRGGGTDQNNSASPTGVAPDPDLAPPFLPISFISPTYSYQNPLAGNPSISIDPSTGLLDGIPNIIGQFVVGVCVKEYRNGVLLSIVRRDFQFNVAQCDPTVVADILEDDTVTQQGQQFYVVNGCGGTVNFINQSFQQTYINAHRWEFDINGTAQQYTAWNATVNFPNPGVYFGRLLVNPGTGCGDTAFIKVNVFPSIQSDFDFAYDTCRAGPVAFTDLSVSGAGPGSITKWDWDFGDGLSSSNKDPAHTYQEPGEIPVTLKVTDENNCGATSTKVVRYFPVPQFFVVAPSEFIGCQPAVIFFDNLSYPVNEEYDVLWDFGDGATANAISPTHVYNDLGTFTVSLKIVSPLGCETDTIFPNLITVLPSPVADFTFSPSQPSNLVPTVHFTDQSTDAVKWKWSFDNDGVSILQNPTFAFLDTGLQRVQLVIFHPSGCTDTTIQFIDVIPEVRYHLPNAFTPNGDGQNDGFRGAGLMEGATNFSMTIWNRYGEKLYETTDYSAEWNGRKNNSGEMAPQGVYIVMVKYTDPRNIPVELRGFATLIK